MHCTQSTSTLESFMNIRSAAVLALSVLASAATLPAHAADSKCGAGSCGKKSATDTKDASCSKKDGACSKKEASCAKSDAACSKKDSACSKKEGSCAKKDASCSKK